MGTSKNNCLHFFVFEKEVETIMRIVDSVKNEWEVFVSLDSIVLPYYLKRRERQL